MKNMKKENPENFDDGMTQVAKREIIPLDEYVTYIQERKAKFIRAKITKSSIKNFLEDLKENLIEKDEPVKKDILNRRIYNLAIKHLGKRFLK